MKYTMTALIGSTMAFAAYQYQTKNQTIFIQQENQTEASSPSSTVNIPKATSASLALQTNDSVDTSTIPLQKNSLTQYTIGAGLSDITGEVAEANMFGWADSKQISSGIHQRLHARAFVINDGVKDALIVVIETGMTSQGLYQTLLKQLAIKYGDRFTKDNVILTATHTHSTPGGFSHYFLYNLTTRGFQEPTFNAVLRGSMRAIDKAIASQSKGRLEFGTSRLKNASVQRSHTAYINNPITEQAENPTETETLMQVLRFVKNGTEVGSLNWFAVHPTSLSSKNTLVSGDNKGYASWFIEKQKGTDYLKGSGYVAAFPNTNPGDVSPNLSLKPGKGPTDDQWENAKIIGQRQAKAALKTATPLTVSGNIDYRQNYVDFSKVKIDAKYTVDGKPHTTCPAAYKTAFAAGSSEDGGGGQELVASGLAAEGRDNPLIKAVGHLVFWPSPSLLACHGTNEVAITMGTVKPTPWTPEVLPTQLLRIGNLAIISVPSEFTTVAGQRLRKLIARKLSIPLKNVIFAGYSNAYAGYITTPEEYKQLDYEGASNHFGPHQLSAWTQNLDKLATAMVKGVPVDPGPTPRDLSHEQLSIAPGVVYDRAPWGKIYGDVAEQPASKYNSGEQAKAVFWSAHPKSTLAYELEVDAQNLRRIEPYTMAIQHKTPHGWQTVATDYDWNTKNQWKRIRVAESQAILTWDIPKDAEPGLYRFYHRGAAKAPWTGEHAPFEGYSHSFNVN